MKRGNLVIYDNRGVIYGQTGDLNADVPAHDYPQGIPYIEIPYGIINEKKLLYIDVSKTPHEPIFEVLEIQKTDAERIAELENQLLLQADETIGGLL